MQNEMMTTNTMPMMGNGLHPNVFPLPAKMGKMVAVLGDLYTFLVSNEESKGAFATIEAHVRPENGPPPHIHHTNEETLFVLEGTFSVLVGDQTLQAESGTYVYVPRGILHTFKNIGMETGRLLVTITPSGFEKFFEAIGTPVSSLEEAFAMNEAPDIEKLMALAPQYDLEIRL